METGIQIPSALIRPIYLSLYVVLSKLWKAPFVASWIVMSKSETVHNSLFCSILSDTLVDSWATCFLMYRRNASLRHILMLLIVNSVTPARYIFIAGPERRDCAPISMGLKPTCSLPNIWTVVHNFFELLRKLSRTFFLLYRWNCWPDILQVGRYRYIIEILSQCFGHKRTGQKRWWFDIYIPTYSFRL